MRCQVYIPKELEEVLLNDAKKAGVNVSEIIMAQSQILWDLGFRS